jgi:hypothetical protein
MIPMDVMAMKMKSTGRNSKTSDPSVLQVGQPSETTLIPKYFRIPADLQQ